MSNELMSTIIGLKDLRENMATYANAVAKGQSFVVVKKSKPIFRISPLQEDEQWETVIDFTRLKKGGVKIQDILARL